MSTDDATAALVAALLQEAVADAAVLFDAEGHVCQANALAYALFGAQDPHGLAAALPADVLAAARERAVEAGVAPVPLDGLVAARKRALRGADGQVCAWLLVVELDREAGHGADEASAAADCGWVWDVARDREVCSRKWLDLFGLRAGDVDGSARVRRERVHPDDLAHVLSGLQAACEPGAAGYAGEFRMRHADGGWRWIRSRARVVARGADGRGLRLVGIDRDVTDERDALLALDSRTALLGLAERLAGIGYWAWDPLSDRVQWSAGLLRTFGLPPDSIPPRLAHAAGLFEPASFLRLQTALRRALEYGEPYSLELETRRADGAHGTVIAAGEPVRDPAGRVWRLWGVTLDVGAQRASQRDQERQSALLRRMSRIAAIGGWSYEVSTQRLEWTEETYRLHDLEPGVAVDPARAIDFYLPPWREQVARAFRLALEQATPFDLECRLRTARGREIWVRALGEAEVTERRIVRVSGTFQDITEAKESRIRLAQALDDLRARNRELQDFTTAASHDLQEPLRKVQALGSLLAGRHGAELGSEARDLVDRMRGAAARMGDLIEDLLAYSRVGRGRAALPEIDLSEVAAGVVADLENEIERSGAVVEIGPLPRLHADPTQMRQLLQNLVGNALKYRGDARVPCVRVSAERVDLRPRDGADPEPHWRLQVADNGIGFEPRFAEEIFAPFHRLHDRSRYQGTGMGLAIVRRIAERHGGRVSAHGVPGEGAVFTVDLPIGGPQGDAGEPA